jgi:hypothetical protein
MLLTRYLACREKANCLKKFFKFFKSGFTTLPLYVCLMFLFSCSSEKLPDSNEIFNEKYGKEIERIKKNRLSSQKKIEITPNTPRNNFTSPIKEDRSTYSNKNVRDFGEVYSSIQFLNQATANKNFSSEIEMFENNYYSAIQFPFQRIGKEFDVIDIPPQDAYGVETEMNDKEYLYISKKLLQNNIDEINQNKDSTHIKNSKILISEQDENQRKEKMKKNFGDDYQDFLNDKNEKK